MRRLRALRRAATPHGRLPSWLDLGIVVVLFAGAIRHTPAHDAGALGVMLNAALVVPLLWRRHSPVAVFVVIWVLAAVQALARTPTVADAALLVAFYTVAASAERRTTAVAGVVLEIGIVAAVTKLARGVDPWGREFVALTGLATAAGVLGINVGSRRQILAGLRERAERLEQERERELALATASERARIAREMHDVVAHNLSVMVALCDGAGYQVHDAPDRAVAALDQAAGAGRQALAEMRQLLGVLRDAPDAPQLAPLPGIRQIEDVVEQVRAAGTPVSYTLSGELGDAPAGMELAIYRIVQEALTNTLKHAGPDARASVRLTCAGGRIEVEVSDTGTSAGPPHAASTGGAGVPGMRQRAAVYGGTLRAGPSPAGGWRVHTSLSLADTEAALT